MILFPTERRDPLTLPLAIGPPFQWRVADARNPRGIVERYKIILDELRDDPKRLRQLFPVSD